MSKPTGGLAFPRAAHEGETTKSGIQTGMTLRDYFAGKALATLVESWADSSPKHAEKCAEIAYQFADAMLAERSKGE